MVPESVTEGDLGSQLLYVMVAGCSCSQTSVDVLMIDDLLC